VVYRERSGREEREGGKLTSLCREDILIVDQVLDGRHHVVDVGRCGEHDLFAALVCPDVV